MSVKGSLIAQAAVGITLMVVCTVSLWRDIHLSAHDIVRRTGGRGAWMERWQAEVIYTICIVAGAILLAGAIQKAARTVTASNPDRLRVRPYAS